MTTAPLKNRSFAAPQRPMPAASARPSAVSAAVGWVGRAAASVADTTVKTARAVTEVVDQSVHYVDLTRVDSRGEQAFKDKLKQAATLTDPTARRTAMNEAHAERQAAQVTYAQTRHQLVQTLELPAEQRHAAQEQLLQRVYGDNPEMLAAMRALAQGMNDRADH